MNNKFLQLLLPLLALLTLSSTALAENLSGNGWSYNDNTKTLTISSSDAWNEINAGNGTNTYAIKYFQNNATTITFTSDCGITDIPSDAFTAYNNYLTVIFPASLKSIYDYAFQSSGVQTAIFLYDPDRSSKSYVTINDDAFPMGKPTLCYNSKRTKFYNDITDFTTQEITCGKGYYILNSNLNIYSTELSGTGWSYNTTSQTLTISSNDAFDEVNYNNETPVDTYLASNTQTIFLTPDVTNVPESAFFGFDALQSVYILSDPQNKQTPTIGSEAFGSAGLTLYYDPNIAEISTEYNTAPITCGTGYYILKNNLNIYSTTTISNNGWSFDPSSQTLTISSSDAWSTIGYSTTTNPIRNYLQSNTKTLNIEEHASLAQIPNNAFQDFTTLTNLSISGSNLVQINQSAFQGCTSLGELSLPSSITYIGVSAFQGCSKLTLTIPSDSKLQMINNSAFSGCTSLANLSLPTTLTNINESAFAGCSNLGALSIPSDSKLTYIGVSAFANSGLTELTLPENSILSSIGNSAFANCSKLTELSLYSTSSYTFTIGESIFSGCSNLTDLILPANLASIPDGTFTDLTNLTNLTLPSSLRNIAASSFAGLTKLANLTLPASVISISDYAFQGCTSLNLTIPSDSNLEYIGVSAFQGCTSLTTLTLPTTLTNIYCTSVFEGCTNLKSISLPNTLSYIGESVFKGCTSLNNLTLPSSLSYIGNSAFQNCTSLDELSLPSNLSYISESAFQGCTSLTTLTIPSDSNLGYIGNSAFQDCTSLGKLSLPANLSYISNSAFQGCTSLTTLTIPDDSELTNIGESAFQDCTSLDELSLPTTLTNIGESAFQGCTSLTTLTIPDYSELQYIGKQAFKDCTSLTTLTIRSHLAEIGESAFQGCSKLTTITCPDLSELVTIGTSAFQDCTSLTTLTLPDMLEEIGKSAFQGCTSLTTLTLPNSLINIRDNAFADCTYLTDVYINSNEATYSESYQHHIYLGEDEGDDNGTNIFPEDLKTKAKPTTLHYDSRNTYIGTEGTDENLRHYFASFHDTSKPATSLQSPTNNSTSSTPLYYDLQGRPLSHPLPNTPTIRILNNHSTLILTK